MPDRLLEELLRCIENKEAVALVTVTDAPSDLREVVGRRALVWMNREPMGGLHLGDWEDRVLEEARAALASKQHRYVDHSKEGGPRIFVEVQRRPPELVIVGAGHIAVPLAEMGTLCGFTVTVLDDREQFAHKSRFPKADRVIAAPLRETVRDLDLDEDSYIVLVTRGHQYDVECLIEVIEKPLAYIGMIGSQRRVNAVFQLLSEEQGIPEEKFDRVYAPIGIDIGAETPAEIAVCIMAEIINVMRGGPARTLSDERRERLQARRERQRVRVQREHFA